MCSAPPEMQKREMSGATENRVISVEQSNIKQQTNVKQQRKEQLCKR